MLSYLPGGVLFSSPWNCDLSVKTRPLSHWQIEAQRSDSLGYTPVARCLNGPQISCGRIVDSCNRCFSKRFSSGCFFFFFVLLLFIIPVTVLLIYFGRYLKFLNQLWAVVVVIWDLEAISGGILFYWQLRIFDNVHNKRNTSRYKSELG